MDSVVVYATRSGNTRSIAEAIARALEPFGHVRAVAAEDASATVYAGADLLIVGGPTESRHATAPVHAFFDRLPAHALEGVKAVAFDTRLDWPRLLSGSAARDIGRWLRQAGATIIAPEQSFIVSMEPSLESGEMQRALEWARSLATAVEPRLTARMRAAAA